MIASSGIVLILGYFMGEMAGKLKLPKLVGMIFAGICCGPYGLDLLSDSFLALSADLRQIALIIILIRAGLTLKLSDLKQAGRPALLMCFVPACFEIVLVAGLAPRFFGISFVDALVMGAVLAAVSPAVVVPRMIHLIENKKGQEHCVPQVVLAGASADDIFVIVLFSSFLLLATTGEMNVMSLVRLPISIVLGIGAGVGLGFLFRHVAHLKTHVLVLFFFAVSFLLVAFEKQVEGSLPFSGLLAILCLALTFNQLANQQAKACSISFNNCWFFGEIFLFVLVGTSVDLTVLPQIGVLSILFVALACGMRMLGVLVCFIQTHFTRKERLFCMVSYCPKATVQAAIGSVPLAAGMASGDVILVVAVIAILFTAPIGAWLIDSLGNRLLD